VSGLLKVATSLFLISITGREHVAQIRGKPVYKITDVTLIPLSSQADAETAIASAREHVRRFNRAQAGGEDETDSEDEDDAPSVTDSLEEGTPPPNVVKDPVTGQMGPPSRDSSVAADVMQRKGVYGRFADKWFSRKGWSADSRRTQGLSSPDLAADAPKNVESIPKEEQQPAGASDLPSPDKNTPAKIAPEDIPKALDGQKDATTVALLPKILKTTRMYFSSGNFFYSYDYDLSHSIGILRPNSSLPLFKQFDPLVSSFQFDALHY
jgi:hypothetical protein